MEIFVSHAKDDRAFALQLVQLLSKFSVDVWVDATYGSGDTERSLELQSALETSEAMVVIISPAAMADVKVSGEWQYFQEREKHIIPLIWQPADIPVPLQRERYVDLHEGDFKAALIMLRTELKLSSTPASGGVVHLIKFRATLTVPPTDTPPNSSNRMERFTQGAQDVLKLAQEEADRLQSNYLGTEHLLLGLIYEEDGVSGRVLREFGVQQERVSEMIERMSRASTHIPNRQPELSPGTKRVLELAADEARRMGHRYIGTEHLLLGLVRLTEGVAIEILKRLGVSPEEIRRQTRKVLLERPNQQDDTPKPPNDSPQPPPPEEDSQ